MTSPPDPAAAAGPAEPVASSQAAARAEPDNARRGGVALEKWYRFLLWLVPTVDKLPRSQKFTLGDRLQSGALDVLNALVEATYTRAPVVLLRRANLGLEQLRFLFRLTLDLRLLDPRRYEVAARAIDEVGRLVGGWIKASGGTHAAPPR